MTNYSMSPFGIWAVPRNARQGERKSIDNLDGEKKVSLRSSVDGILRDLRGDNLTIDPLNDDRAYGVRTISEASSFTYADVGVARRGIEGQLRKEVGAPIPIGAKDWNETWLRVLVLYPPGGSQAYWLCERVYGVPIVAYFSSRFKLKSQSDVGDKITTYVDAVSNWEALTDWLKKVSIKELIFDSPRTPGAQQSVDVDGLRGSVRIVVKPSASFPLKRVLKKSRPNADAVFGLLRGVPALKKKSSSSYIKDGWGATVVYDTPGGKQRSFGVATDAEAPTLIYAVGETDKLERPERKEFLAACIEFIDDMVPSDPALAAVKSELEAWGGTDSRDGVNT